MAKNHPSHISKPVYPGGVTAMRKFVTANLKYPQEALTAKVEGTVTIRYSLDYRGKVIETKVKKSLGHGCDEEAVRVVKLLRFDVPQARKKKVRIHQDVSIHFKLPKSKTAPAPRPPKAPAPPPRNQASAPVRINYVSTKNTVQGKVTKPTRQSGGTYTYTVTVK